MNQCSNLDWLGRWPRVFVRAIWAMSRIRVASILVLRTCLFAMSILAAQAGAQAGSLDGATPPQQDALSAAKPAYRFPDKVGLRTDFPAVRVYYVYRFRNGAPLLAADGKPEPFLIASSSGREAVGLFGGQRVVVRREKERLIRIGGREVLEIPARMAKTGVAVTLRHCCQDDPRKVPPREGFSEAAWQEKDAMAESLQLFTLAERGEHSPFKDCSGVEYPMGFFIPGTPEFVLRWRLVYVTDAFMEVTRCNGYFNLNSGASVGDSLGDGSRLAAIESIPIYIFRVDEHTGLPIGPLPADITVVTVDELLAFRAAFRATQEQSSLPLPIGQQGSRWSVDYPEERWRLNDAYQHALLMHFFPRKGPKPQNTKTTVNPGATPTGSKKNRS